MTTGQMIEQAAAAKRHLGCISSAVFDTKAGKVACFIDHARMGKKDKHSAARFNLNGKPISRANLEAALSA